MCINRWLWVNYWSILCNLWTSLVLISYRKYRGGSEKKVISCVIRRAINVWCPQHWSGMGYVIKLVRGDQSQSLTACLTYSLSLLPPVRHYSVTPSSARTCVCVWWGKNGMVLIVGVVNCLTPTLDIVMEWMESDCVVVVLIPRASSSPASHLLLSIWGRLIHQQKGKCDNNKKK